jgi:hypothetical protein
MSECLDNHWQPTFVHDVDRPEPSGAPFYVMPDGNFIKLRGNTGPEWIAHARELIQRYGVRDPRGFTTPEEYTRIQCGCRRGLSEGNNTCARFLAGH